MKILIKLLILFIPFTLYSQDIDQIRNQFWDSVDKNDDEKIADYGTQLIDNIELYNIEFDTTIAEIRIRTALSFSNLTNYNKSIELNLKTLLLIKETLSENHNYYSITLNNLAADYMLTNNLIKALDYKLIELNLIKRNYGEKNLKYAEGASTLAFYYNKLGNYLKSIEFEYKALEIYESTLGEKNPNYLESLSSLAGYHSNQGFYTKSLEYNLKVATILNKSKTEDAYAKIQCQINIALNYCNLKNFHESIKHNFIALGLIEKCYNRSHPLYFLYLISIAKTYSGMGENWKSLELNLQALEFSKNKNQPIILNNIAVQFIKMGNYSKSIEYSFRAIKLIDEKLGRKHPDYSMALSNMALAFSKLGNFSKSLELNLRALEIRLETIGSQHLDYATSLNNIAVNYLMLGDYNISLQYLYQSLGIYEKKLESGNLDFAAIYNNIALNYFLLKDFSKSLIFNLKAIQLHQQNFNHNNVEYAKCLNSTGISYKNLGDNIKSLEYFSKALSIIEFYNNTNEDLYSQILSNLASIYAKMGDNNTAILNFKKSYSLYFNSFSKNKFGLNENLLKTHKNKLEVSYYVCANLLSYDSSLIPFLADAWINLNGVLASDNRNLEKSIAENADSSLVLLLEKLKQSKMQLSRYNELSINEIPNLNIKTQELQDEIENMERTLSSESKAFADFNRHFRGRDVSQALEHNEYFIDIARIPHYSFYSNSWTDSTKYLVFISDGKDTIAEHIILDNGNELENLAYPIYASHTHENNKNSQTLDEVSFDFFWKPIAERIKNAKTVYISLGGIYNNLNLNTLYNPDNGKFLIEDVDIRIVNSARDFILMKERNKKIYPNNTAALFGYPYYDGEISPLADTADYLTATRDLAANWIDSLTRGGIKANLLPGTKKEVENIGATFKNNDWNVSVFLEDKASEYNIKTLKSPRVLHIATHGYFFENTKQEGSFNRFLLGLESQKAIQEPLLRSGLLFTGANKALQGQKIQGENGLLSAYEASLLDLRNTELVVLSACETGKGTIQNSEGVYGLRKAIADAGAANTIMSLWKVDDNVTQEFMTNFYVTWLSGKTIRDAFYETQLAIKTKFPQPYFWGAFILVGE